MSFNTTTVTALQPQGEPLSAHQLSLFTARQNSFPTSTCTTRPRANHLPHKNLHFLPQEGNPSRKELAFTPYLRKDVLPHKTCTPYLRKDLLPHMLPQEGRLFTQVLEFLTSGRTSFHTSTCIPYLRKDVLPHKNLCSSPQEGCPSTEELTILRSPEGLMLEPCFRHIDLSSENPIYTHSFSAFRL
ncbi:hypothetical protein ElyMa_000301200 [Elysia marginata]|uniref:Uncharacterized protein n=1 Tax=Elysia marginata TaxID=1093978 RepID=A0AAV4F8A9_9GAST|nr:hypothetical protein ElyMa_000301200 [Elysia marginata]